MDPWGASDRIELVVQRYEFLDRLAESPARKPALVEDLDASRSTVDRAIRRLEAAEFVERADEGYATTVLGRLAAERYREFVADERGLLSAEDVLGALPRDAEVPSTLLSGATVEAAPDAPYRLYDRVIDDVADADRCRILLPRLGDSRPLRLCHARAVEDGLDVELVVAPAVLERIRAEFPHLSAELADHGGVEVRVGEVVPFELYRTDGTEGAAASLVTVDADGAVGLVRSDSDDAVEWADGRWSAARAESSSATADLAAPDPGSGATPSVTPSTGPGTLRAAGFRRVTGDYFTDRTPNDPATAWRVGFDLVDVYYGCAFEREDRPAPEGSPASPAEADASADRRPVVDVLVERLSAGEDHVVVGPPGAGKSTTCRAVACRWVGTDRGPVLYRPARNDVAAGALSDALDAAREAAGHALVVVEDATAIATETLSALGKVRDESDVTLLLEGRASDWRALDAEVSDPRLQELHRNAVTEYRLPGVDERACRRAIETFEATTGRSVPLSPGELLDAVHNEDGAGEMYLLSHLLTAHTVPSPWDEDGAPTALEADVRSTYDALVAADDEVAVEVGLLVATLTAAELPVRAGDAHAVAAAREDAPDAHHRVAAALDSLSGRMTFGTREDGGFRTQHPFWAVRFLAHALDRDDRRTVARFERALDAVFGLAADPDRGAGIERWLDRESPAVRRFEDDGAADRFVEAVFELATDHSELVPLFGTTERSGIDLPAGCSPRTRLEAVSCRAHAWHDHGELDRAATAFELLSERAAEADAAPEVRARFRAEGHRGLGEVYEERDEIAAAREEFEAGLPVAREAGLDRKEAALLNSLSWLSIVTDDYETAEDRLAAALSATEAVGPCGPRSDTLFYYGQLAWNRGNLERAEEWLNRTREVDRERGNRQGEAATLNAMGLVAEEREDHDSAEGYYRRSVEIRRETDDRPGTATTLHNLGDLLVKTGDLLAAEDCLERALSIVDEVGMDGLEGNVRNALGNLALERDELDAAADHHRRALSVAESVDRPRVAACAEAGLADVDSERGEYDAATERYREAFDTFEEIGARIRALDAAERLVAVNESRGDPEAAREWCHRCVDLAAEAGLDDRRERFEDRLGDLAASADD